MLKLTQQLFGSADQDLNRTGGDTAVFWALAENPEQFAKLRDNPALNPSFLDGWIRWGRR